MQAGGGFVQQVERLSASGPLQLGGQFDALRLSAREFGGGLSKPQIAQAHLAQGIEAAEHRRVVLEERPGRLDGHAEHLGDGAVLIPDLQRLVVEARAMAHRARRVHAGQEQQFDHHPALALAVVAAPARDIEGEAARAVPALPGERRGGEQLADVVEQACISRHVAARRAADRLLVDLHQPRDRVELAAQLRTRRLLGKVSEVFLTGWAVGGLRGLLTEMGRQRLRQHLTDQRGFARPRDTRHRGQHTERKPDVEVLEVVTGDAVQVQPPRGRARLTRLLRRGSEQVLGRSGGPNLPQPLRRPAVENLAALLPRPRPDVHQPVGAAHHVQVVFHHEQRVAHGLQAAERREQRLGVGRMQSGGGFVEHIHHTEQVGVQLRGEAQPLQLAG